jgi:hypothetical protein
MAWQGVALARFYAGNWKAGHEAVAKARAAAGRPFERDEADALGAMALVAEGKSAEGVAKLDVMEKTTDPLRGRPALSVLQRGLARLRAGQYRRAITEADTVIALVEEGKMQPIFGNQLRTRALTLAAATYAHLGDTSDAEKGRRRVDRGGR